MNVFTIKNEILSDIYSVKKYTLNVEAIYKSNFFLISAKT
jgi:hypothetical protein